MSKKVKEKEEKVQVKPTGETAKITLPLLGELEYSVLKAEGHELTPEVQFIINLFKDNEILNQRFEMLTKQATEQIKLHRNTIELYELKIKELESE